MTTNRERTCGRLARRVTLLLFTLVSAATVSAQSSGAEDAPFAPFVSRLRLSIRDPQIRVTWEDAADIVAEYRVYRSREPITNETLSEATFIATVGPGEEAYIDIPPAPGGYHYAVLAESPAGNPYRVVIPGRNASFREVVIENVATEAERAARVERIDAIVVETEGRRAIELTAVADREGRTLAVYRATTPIDDVTDLADAAFVREVDSAEARLIDLPVPGVAYYYATVDSALLLAGGAEIVMGENATAAPVEIPLRIAAGPTASRPPARETPADAPLFSPPATTARGLPVPFLQLQNRLATGRRLQDPRIMIPDTKPLREETERTVDSLLSGLGPRTTPGTSLTVLDEDRIPDPEGAEYTLRTILDGPFARRAWEEAIGQLDNFFSLPLTPELEARAYFYRGQAFHFLGERQRAVLELLLARDYYYVESDAWLDRILGNRET